MKVELLAPAGSWEALTAAVQNGADAVYLGLQAFGARHYAKNFDVDGLREAAQYCHLRGVQIHVAVHLAQEAVRAGADALIVQDLGLARTLHEAGIPVPLHASTQMTIHNTAGAAFVRKAGFQRVVLARELPKQEIEEIVKNVPIETEVFVHGALCISYSGQCLMSSLLGRRSGNRGKCAQPCRLPYTMLEDGNPVKSGYLMSPKDLCLGTRIPEIIQMGVTSLKIEGRMKSAPYVAAVTKVYRDCLDNGRAMTGEEAALLRRVFSRSEFTEAFYAGKIGRGMMKIEASNDDIYDNQDATLLKKLKASYAPGVERRYQRICVSVKISIGKPIRAYAKVDGVQVFSQGMKAQPAVGNPVTREMVAEQFGKLGGSNFLLQYLKIELQEGTFVTKSALNAVRRDLIGQLSSRLGTAPYQTWTAAYLPHLKKNSTKHTKNIHIWVNNEAQAEALADLPVQRRYIPIRCIGERSATENVVAVFPVILRQEAMKHALQQLDECKQRAITGIAAGNAGLLLEARSRGFALYGTSDLNASNASAVAFWQKFGLCSLEASRELNLKCLAAMAKGSPIPIEAIGYGKIELMKIENCLVHVAKNGCYCDPQKAYELLDRKGARMRVGRDGCISTVYNSVPVAMADRQNELWDSGISAIKLVFTDEPPDVCRQICLDYMEGRNRMPAQFTRGHYYRGAE